MRARLVRWVALAGIAAALVGCSNDSADTPKPPGPAVDDPEMAEAQDLYVQNCSGCHGISGNMPGSIGPVLAGNVEEKYPNIIDQESVIVMGIGVPPNQMPSFNGVLTAEQIHAIAVYTRDVL